MVGIHRSALKYGIEPREGVDYNVIECRDCVRGVSILEDNTIDLVLTAPPYDSSLVTNFEEYKEFLRVTFYLAYNKLVDGGRCVVSLPSKVLVNGKKIYLISHFNLLMEEIGYTFQEDIIWEQSDTKDYVLVYTKSAQEDKGTEEETVTKYNKDKGMLPDKGVLPDKGIWKINSVGEKNGVTPFPVGLSDRVITQYSKEGELVLDFFIGTGTTAISCIKHNRKYIGYDNNQSLVDLSKTLIERYQSQDK